MNAHLPHYAAAIRFLERDAHANRELLLALQYEPVKDLRVAFRGAEVRGVLVRGAGPFNPDPDWLRLEALDVAAVDALLDGIVITPRLVLSVHRPAIGRHLAEHYGVRATGTGVYGYLLRRAGLILPATIEARLLTPRDSALVERSECGWSRGYFEQLFADSRRPWAVIREGLIVSRASSGYGQRDSEEVVGVWTDPRWRGQGLARGLVAAVAADILERMPYATYTTTYDNLASQAVARAVGFQPCFAADSYQLHAAAQGDLGRSFDWT